MLAFDCCVQAMRIGRYMRIYYILSLTAKRKHAFTRCTYNGSCIWCKYKCVYVNRQFELVHYSHCVQWHNFLRLTYAYIHTIGATGVEWDSKKVHRFIPNVILNVVLSPYKQTHTQNHIPIHVNFITNLSRAIRWDACLF